MSEMKKAAQDAGTSNTAKDSRRGHWGRFFLEPSYLKFSTSPLPVQEGS